MPGPLARRLFFPPSAPEEPDLEAGEGGDEVYDEEGDYDDDGGEGHDDDGGEGYDEELGENCTASVPLDEPRGFECTPASGAEEQRPLVD